jgi:hypothetical protein
MASDFGVRLPGAIRKVGRGALKVGKIVTTPGRLAFKFATTPIRNRVNTLVTRRARKLAWDRRRSKTPTQAENVEARAWTKRHLQSQGPSGRLLAFFAGAMDPSAVLLGNFGQGWEEAVMASIPVLVALIAKIMVDAAKSGAAPVDPTVGARQQVETTVRQQVEALTPAVQQAVEAVRQSVEQAATPEEQVAPPVGPAPVGPEEMQGAAPGRHRATVRRAKLRTGPTLGRDVSVNPDDIRLLGLLGQATPPSGTGWIAVGLAFVAAGTGVVIAMRR